MDHTERQEHSVTLGPQEIPPSGDFPGAKGFAFLKANSHLKIQSLPILDNLVSPKKIQFGGFSLLPLITIGGLVYPNSFLPLQE